MVKPRENRVPIMMSDEEMKAIDDWRFENRIATRSEAIRRLVQVGLRTHDHLQELASQSSTMVSKVESIEDQSEKILVDHAKEGDLTLYAAKMAILFSDQFGSLADEVFDTHNRLVDLVYEINAIQQTTEIEKAIEKADDLRTASLEQKKRLEQNAADWKRPNKGSADE